MKSLSLTGFTATIATGLLLNVGTANAIGIPVFDVSMVTQTLQNVLQHIQENSLIDGQKKKERNSCRQWATSAVWTD